MSYIGTTTQGGRACVSGGAVAADISRHHGDHRCHYHGLDSLHMPPPSASRRRRRGGFRPRRRLPAAASSLRMGLGLALLVLLLHLLLQEGRAATMTSSSRSSSTTTEPPAGWMGECQETLGLDLIASIEEPLDASGVCRRLWDRALAHHELEQQPPHQQHPAHKPFFGPWHFGSGRDGESVGPLGTSGEYATFKDPDDVLNLCVALGCVVCAAMAAGLTIGLMSIDPLELEIKQRVGTAEECRQASVVLPLIQRHHLLLVTLLLYNSAANETLPLFLDRLVPSYVAVLLSVTMVLLFGEILPSALFSGPNQLRIAARLSKFVWFLMLVLAPLSYPLAWLLDRWFGHHNPRKRYNRAELSALIEIHREVKRRNISIAASNQAVGHSHQRSLSTGATAARAGLLSLSHPGADDDGGNDNGGGGGLLRLGGGGQQQSGKKPPPHGAIAGAGTGAIAGAAGAMLSQDEVDIVVGVLKIASKTAADCMVPWERVFCLSTADELDERLLAVIMASGYSRIPVYEGDDPAHVKGFLLVKRLIVIDPAARRPVGSLALRRPLVVSPECGLIDLLNAFQEGRSHLALVAKEPHQALDCMTRGLPLRGGAAPVGIVTLEDLIEEIIQEEILDEHDRGRELLEQRQQRQQRQQRNNNSNGSSRARLGSTTAATQVVSASLLRKQQQQQQQLQLLQQGSQGDEEEEDGEEEEEEEGLLQATGVGVDVDVESGRGGAARSGSGSNGSSTTATLPLPTILTSSHGLGSLDVRQQVVLDLAIHALKSNTTAASSPFASAPATLSQDMGADGEEDREASLLVLGEGAPAGGGNGSGAVALPPAPPISPHHRLRGLVQASSASGSTSPAKAHQSASDPPPRMHVSGEAAAEAEVKDQGGHAEAGDKGAIIPEAGRGRKQRTGLEEPLLPPSSDDGHRHDGE